MMREKIQNLFIFWIGILPLVVWGGYYEGPKIIYFYGGSFLVFIFWIVRMLKYKKYFVFGRADIFYFLWLVTLLFASALGVHPFQSIVGGSYRHQGVLFFLALLVVGKSVGSLNTSGKNLLSKIIAISVLTESFILVFQYVSGSLYFGKPLGTLGEANAVAGFLGMGSYFVFENFPVFLLFLSFVAILISESRSGILTVVPYLMKIKKSFWLILIPLLLLGVFGLSVIKGFSFFENRPTIWKLGIEKILQKPIFGYGAESGEVVYDLAFSGNNTPLNSLIIDRTHNLFLDVLMWSGVLGLVPFVLWLYYSFRNIKNFTIKLAFVSFILFSFFQPLSVVHWILMIIIVNI